MFITFFPSDVEKQLAVEKESLDNLRKQIEEAQKQSGKIIKAESWIFSSFVSGWQIFLIYINYERILLLPPFQLPLFPLKSWKQDYGFFQVFL